MKKYLLFITSSFLFISSPSFGQTDYSQTNPFTKKYSYEVSGTKVIKQVNKPELSKITANQTKTPDNIGKYKYLAQNSEALKGCWDKAGQAYNIDPWLLFAIANVESSFDSNAINRNNDKNKSVDIGIMQINTFWFPILEKKGISKERLYDPCVSIHVGAWIVSQNIKRFGYNLDGIGAYNSPNKPAIRRKYGMKVYKAYYELLNDFGIQITSSN